MKHHIRIAPPGPKASRIIEITKKHTYDSTFVYPLVIKGGHDCVIEDVDGNEFLDFTSNVGSCPLGYSHPEILQVLKEYSNNGAHKIAGQDFYSEEHAALAERLVSILPGGFKVFLINSGAEAVENSIKIAYRKMGPLPGVSCKNAFHGRTLGALTFTSSKPVQKTNFPELPVLRIKFCTTDDDPEINSAEDILKENKVAFIISETIQGEGGYSIASKKFIQNLRKLATKYGVPLILDEVQSGLGHTGKWWAFEHYGVEPDIMSMAKALQVGATGFRAELEPTEKGVISSTWGGGARIDMAVGAKTIQVIEKEKLLENAIKMGTVLKNGISELCGKNGIEDVRGIGLMIGIECQSKERRDAVLLSMFRHGILALGAGQKAIRIIPPLIINEEQVNEGISVIHESCSAL
ncbi:MAG: aminotransferase class III-fold pyridoxal phosphate-dependent enzyme [Candidatus Nitrosotenuis sp.]|uniref:Putative Acetylornithine aminotransferase n=1 Tax=Candidatus Nitrosotenuis uzonensis TaxID=1407055 RepID=A0A812EVK1_9ARCH|nr:aminotransferase class III-fold pyridoxal phosphate-dependent enzyme [Candidatus Nitrosotenuis uzonensis]CAE6489813.1 putative Acetylornithine aminotransferase [Candidatus Nitrosotenuis uzonensis]